MKTELLLELSGIITSGDSIKHSANRIKQLRDKLDIFLTDIEKTDISHKIKVAVQAEAEKAFIKAGGIGAIIMATGSGKSRIAVDLACDMISLNEDTKILIVVPTEKLRDENWKDEFVKWGFGNSWNFIERCCYASLNKYTGQVFDLVVLDEGHNITENNSEFFNNNIAKSLLMLTATKPRDRIKIDILKSIGLHPVYELTLDESVKLGLVSEYEITIVTMKLDNVDKYIKSGNKKNTFYTTESSNYQYLSRLCLAAPNKVNFIRRMQFIYSLRSKTEAAKQILEKVIPTDLRTLIFCGSKRQAVAVNDRRFFSKPTLAKPKGLLTPFKEQLYNKKLEEYAEMLDLYEGDEGFNDFKNKAINRLACVDSLNEGHNISDLDCAFLVQLDSNDLNLIQRIGRTIRFRPGHTAKIIILCVEDTVDLNWVNKSTEGLSEVTIRRVSLGDLLKGDYKINFN